MAILTTDWQVLSEVTMSPGKYLQTIARYTSQSIDGNYSEVEAQLRIRMANGNAVHCYTHSCNFSGGTFDASDSKGSYYHGWEQNTTTTLLTQTKRINHDSNGDASFNIQGYFTCSAGVSGTTSSITCYLPHINRLSVFSLDKPNFDIGDLINFSITKYASGYTNNLYMVLGNNEVLIESNVGSSVQVDTSLLANQIYQQIPNANSYSNVFKLYTYNGGTLLGSKTINYTANIVDSNPTFNVAYQDTNATTTALTSDNQKIIQNKSTLQINITSANAIHYAGSLASVSVIIENQVTTISLSGTSNVSANIDIGTINLSQNTTARIRVTDSRGNSLEKTLTLTILPYMPPYAAILLKRKLNYYTQTDIKVTSTYSSLDNLNTISISYRIKKTTDNSWGSYSSLTDDTLTTFNADNNYAWDVQVLLQDALDSRTISMVLSSGLPTFYVDVLNNSVGINCFPSRTGTIEANGVDISNTYSIVEDIPVGTWIDGKPIYRKVIPYWLISLTSTTILQDSVIDDLENFVDVRINMLETNTNNWQFLPKAHQSSNWIIGYYYNATDGFKLEVGADAVNIPYWTIFLIVEYTKQ